MYHMKKCIIMHIKFNLKHLMFGSHFGYRYVKGNIILKQMFKE